MAAMSVTESSVTLLLSPTASSFQDIPRPGKRMPTRWTPGSRPRHQDRGGLLADIDVDGALPGGAHLGGPILEGIPGRQRRRPAARAGAAAPARSSAGLRANGLRSLQYRNPSCTLGSGARCPDAQATSTPTTGTATLRRKTRSPTPGRRTPCPARASGPRRRRRRSPPSRPPSLVSQNGTWYSRAARAASWAQSASDRSPRDPMPRPVAPHRAPDPRRPRRG